MRIFAIPVATLSIIVAVVAAQPALPSAPRCPLGVLRFVMTPPEPNDRSAPAYRALARRIGSAVGCAVRFSVAATANAEVDAMDRGQIDIATMIVPQYILARRKSLVVAIGAPAGADGKPLAYHANILVRSSSPEHDVRALRGKRFAYTNFASPSGYLFPAAALAESGIDPQQGIKPVYLTTHKRTIAALRTGAVDAAEVSTTTEAREIAAGRFDAANYRVLWTSAPIVADPIVVRSSLPPSFRHALASALINLDVSTISTARDAFGAARFVAVKDADYQPYRAALRSAHVDLKHLPAPA